MFFLVIACWIVAGLVAGLVANRVVNLRGDDPKFGLAAAVVGAVVGGASCAVIGGSGVSAWSWWGLAAAAAGGTVAAIAWHLVRSRSISHDTYKPRSSY